MAEHSDHPADNPYPGPRPFRPGEKLYGRDTEITQLFYLLTAERIVVLHSPSGAGKSSLLYAGLVPRLQQERFDVWPSIRLSLQPDSDAQPTNNANRPANGANRFVQSLILSLEEGLPQRRRRPFAQIAHQSLTQYIAGRPRRPGSASSILLIFDQFEEIVTLDPIDVQAKRAFFEQLGETLKNPDIWALFALREDYLAPLDPYRDDVPTRLSNTFRIDLLDIAAGREAMSKPAADAGRMFGDEAVEQLANDLATVSIQQPDGSFQTQTGRYVEPVQLQVVCRRLWGQLSPETRTIRVEHLQTSGDVNEALSAYYEGCLSQQAADDVSTERRLRGIRSRIVGCRGEKAGSGAGALVSIESLEEEVPRTAVLFAAGCQRARAAGENSDGTQNVV
jgi:hypothetical protein